MVDRDLLGILVCPESRQKVEPADEELLARVNGAITKGEAKNRAGDPVREPLEEALVRADGELLYPVREGIPIMLLDEAIPLNILS